MNKIIASAGAVALGLLGMQGAYAAPQVESSEKALPWLSASLSVRGFYDDNINSSSRPYYKDSWGMQVVPSVGLKYQDDATLASARYEYGYTWYADRKPHDDQSHLVDAVFSHQFNDNVRVDVSDSFAVAQEGSVLSDFGGAQLMTRADGDNIRNFAQILLGVKYYENLGFEIGYRNALWDFDNDEYAFILNRMEHTPHLDFYYDLDEINRFFIGYEMNYSDYTGSGNRPLTDKYGSWVGFYESDLYDRMSHAGYLGYRLTLAEGLDWTTRAGAQYTYFENVKDYKKTYADLGLERDTTNPFVESTLTWNYLENCSAQLGVRHAIAASQWGAMDSEVTTVYASIRHQILDRLEGAISGVYQHSSYGKSPSGGVNDNARDDYYSVGPSLSFRITGMDAPVGVFVDASYSYDDLVSNIRNRSYNRNRVTLGLRATY